MGKFSRLLIQAKIYSPELNSYFQLISIIFFLCPLLQPQVGKLIKHILHIPLSPQIQPPSCSTNLTNSQTISSFQKWSSILDQSNTLDTPTILGLPDFHISVLQSLTPSFCQIRLLDKMDSCLIERVFFCTLLFPHHLPRNTHIHTHRSQFCLCIQYCFTSVAQFLCHKVAGISSGFQRKMNCLDVVCV